MYDAQSARLLLGALLIKPTFMLDEKYPLNKALKLLKPLKTNADNIRAMSDEDMANLLTDYSNNSGWVTEIGREICFERIYEWLKQPTE